MIDQMTVTPSPHLENPAELKALEDEMLRKIGRNMVTFQQLEGALKTLVTYSNVRTGLNEKLQTDEATRRQKIQKSTLGGLVTQFTTESLTPEGIPELDAVDEDEHLVPTFNFRFSVETDQVNICQRTAALELLVKERNELVHHFLPKWKRGSRESAQAMNRDLDAQHARVRAEIDILRPLLEALQRLIQHAASPEYALQMELSWLQHSPVVKRLATMSLNADSTEGWVSLQTAGQVLWKDLNEDMSSLNERYGHKKLRPLLVAAQFFDLRDEPLANGCSRVFFKINDAEKAHQSAA